MILKQSNLMKKYCSGTMPEEVDWCYAYGSQECISNGMCGYRSEKLLEELAKEFENDCRLLEFLGGRG